MTKAQSHKWPADNTHPKNRKQVPSPQPCHPLDSHTKVSQQGPSRVSPFPTKGIALFRPDAVCQETKVVSHETQNARRLCISWNSTGRVCSSLWSLCKRVFFSCSVLVLNKLFVCLAVSFTRTGRTGTGRTEQEVTMMRMQNARKVASPFPRRSFRFLAGSQIVLALGCVVLAGVDMVLCRHRMNLCYEARNSRFQRWDSTSLLKEKMTNSRWFSSQMVVAGCVPASRWTDDSKSLLVKIHCEQLYFDKGEPECTSNIWNSWNYKWDGLQSRKMFFLSQLVSSTKCPVLNSGCWIRRQRDRIKMAKDVTNSSYCHMWFRMMLCPRMLGRDDGVPPEVNTGFWGLVTWFNTAKSLVTAPLVCSTILPVCILWIVNAIVLQDVGGWHRVLGAGLVLPHDAETALLSRHHLLCHDCESVGQTLLIGAWGNKNWVYLVPKQSKNEIWSEVCSLIGN